MSTAVTFGWPRAGETNVPAGVVWVAPSGRVVEALVWPPVVKRQIVNALDIQTAWSIVQSGKAPIALHGNVVGLPPKGVGSEMQVCVVQVLVTSRRGSPQLVPAYRFSGEVQLEGGQGVHAWYALVPAGSR